MRQVTEVAAAVMVKYAVVTLMMVMVVDMVIPAIPFDTGGGCFGAIDSKCFFYETCFIASLYGWDYYRCVDTILAFYGYVDFVNPSLLLSLMLEHNSLDTWCFRVSYMH